MKTLTSLTLLLLLLSSFKSYTICESKGKKNLITSEIKDVKSSMQIEKLTSDKEIYTKGEAIITKLSENFSVEIDGTFVNTKSLYKRHSIQLRFKKDAFLFYKESI